MGANRCYSPCEEGLRALEARGYVVRRVRGYAAIDQARSQLASDALAEGFEEILWIDADMGFKASAPNLGRRGGRPKSHADEVSRDATRRLEPTGCEYRYHAFS